MVIGNVMFFFLYIFFDFYIFYGIDYFLRSMNDMFWCVVFIYLGIDSGVMINRIIYIFV